MHTVFRGLLGEASFTPTQRTSAVVGGQTCERGQRTQIESRRQRPYGSSVFFTPSPRRRLHVLRLEIP